MNSSDIFIAGGLIIFCLLFLHRFVGLNWEALGVIVVTLALIVSAVNTYETRRIANQTLEDSLRPLILRSGVLINWEIQSKKDIESLADYSSVRLLEFVNHKNVATNLSGSVVLDGKQFPLFFTNSLAQKTDENITNMNVFKRWAWLPENGTVQAIYDSDIFTEVEKENQILLEYKDINGNSYYTKEDKNFSQTSNAVK